MLNQSQGNSPKHSSPSGYIPDTATMIMTDRFLEDITVGLASHTHTRITKQRDCTQTPTVISLPTTLLAKSIPALGFPDVGRKGRMQISINNRIRSELGLWIINEEPECAGTSGFSCLMG